MGTHVGHDGYGSAVQEALRGPARELRRAIPDVSMGFAARHDSAPDDSESAATSQTVS